MKLWTVALMLMGSATPALANEIMGLHDGEVSAGEPGDEPGDLPIINGSDAAVADYPMTGGLIAEGKIAGFGGMTFLCSSTLIAPDVVLTAAHCVDIEAMLGGLQLDELKFHYIRDADLTAFQLGASAEGSADAGTGAKVRGVPRLCWCPRRANRFVREPRYCVNLFRYTCGPPYAYLPTKEEFPQIVVDMDVTIVGWGQQTSSQQPEPGTVQVKQVRKLYLRNGRHRIQGGRRASGWPKMSW